MLKAMLGNLLVSLWPSSQTPAAPKTSSPKDSSSPSPLPSSDSTEKNRKEDNSKENLSLYCPNSGSSGRRAIEAAKKQLDKETLTEQPPFLPGKAWEKLTGWEKNTLSDLIPPREELKKSDNKEAQAIANELQELQKLGDRGHRGFQGIEYVYKRQALGVLGAYPGDPNHFTYSYKTSKSDYETAMHLPLALCDSDATALFSRIKYAFYMKMIGEGEF